jgi:hypothetical protein
MGHKMRIRLGATAAILALAVAGFQTPTASSVESGAGAEQWPGPECPDVLLLFARGSGEEPARSVEPNDYNAETNWGMGSVGTSFRKKLQRRTEDRQLSFGYEGVTYEALPVPMVDKSTWLDPITIDTYKIGVSTGATAIRLRVLQIMQSCDPGAHMGHSNVPSIVIGGYSQGAWAARRALNLMPPEQQELVDAIVLFGDPTKRWTEPSVRWREDEQNPLKLGVALRSGMADAAEDGILPSHLQGRTSNFCIPRDFVCGGNRLGPHSKYPDEATGVAADFVQTRLPVGPTNLPKARDLASIYPYLRGGSRELLYDFGTGEWPSETACFNWTDGFIAPSGRWAGFYTRDGHMPYFQGLEDPAVFVYKFHNPKGARTAYNTMAAFVDKCDGGTHTFDASDELASSWTVQRLKSSTVGKASVGYRSQRDDYSVTTGWDTQYELNLAVLEGRYLFRVMNHHDYVQPARANAVDVAKKTLRLLG